MTALPSRLSFETSRPAQPTRPAPAVSRSDLSAQGAGPVSAAALDNVIRLRRIDSDAFRAWFAPKFAEYLRSRFARPEDVAVAFAVRPSTAWNWWNGDNRATGDAVARAFIALPDAVAWFMAEWGAR